MTSPEAPTSSPEVPSSAEEAEASRAGRAHAVATTVVGHLAIAVVAFCTYGIATGHLRHHVRVEGAPMPRGPLQHLPRVHEPDHVILLWLLLASYVVAVLCARRIRVTPLLLVVGALSALLALTPPRPLTDLFSYVAYGRMLGLDGIDPYLVGPRAIATDPSFLYVSSEWYRTPTVYGPVFTGLSAGVAPLGVLGAAWALKGVAAIAAFASALLVGLAARRTDPRPGSASAAVVLLGCNPLLLAYGVGGGHNDVLMILPLSAGLWLLARRSDALGAALVTLAPAIKASGGLALPFLLVGERRWRILVAVLGAGAVLLGGTLLAFGTAPFRATGVIGAHTADGHHHSLPAFVATKLGQGVPSDATFDGLEIGAGVVVLVLLALTALRRIRWTTAAALATATVVLTAGTSFAWYVVWVLPLAAVARRRALPTVAVVLLTALFVAFQTDGLGPF